MAREEEEKEEADDLRESLESTNANADYEARPFSSPSRPSSCCYCGCKRERRTCAGKRNNNRCTANETTTIATTTTATTTTAKSRAQHTLEDVCSSSTNTHSTHSLYDTNGIKCKENQNNHRR